jgi:hypothetical protein
MSSSSVESNISSSLNLPSPNSNQLSTIFNDFNNLINNITLTPPFASISDSPQTRFKPGPTKPQTLLKNLTVIERAFIGAAGGGIAGAFTYACLHPLDTIKTKMQAKGASQIYKNTLDAVSKTFTTNGILGFYSGFSAVVVGSTASSAIYFGSCEFGKSFLSKQNCPKILIPPISGALGNVLSSAIMVPKELITQRMQTGAKGRSYQVLINILQNEGVLGLYRGYSATLLRNLPAGVLSYSSFEYLKLAVMKSTNKNHLEPIQSVICGALAGAISASITTPLDVVKTRLMTQARNEAVGKVATVMYGGVKDTIGEILKEEGLVGFTRGMGPRVLHSACFSALGYFAFETARIAILNEYVKRKQLNLEDVVVVSGSN